MRAYQVSPSDYYGSPLCNSQNYKVPKAIYDKVIECKINDLTVPFNFALDLRAYLQHGNKIDLFLNLFYINLFYFLISFKKKNWYLDNYLFLSSLKNLSILDYIKVQSMSGDL